VWYQLTLKKVANTDVEQISDALMELGALSITLLDKNDDPILEPEIGSMPLWREVVIQTLFQLEEEAESAAHALLNSFPTFDYFIERIEDKDWERVWMDDFKPQSYGERLWICPSWTSPPDPDATNVLLDPGLAFGSGSHPTTSLCLQWLDAHDLDQSELIDFGCGSGVLAIAALKLGAKHVYAVDIDPQALTATEQNAKNNAIVSDSISIDSPDVLQQPVDIILANILLSPLLELKERFLHLLKPQGKLIVSGILNDQVKELCAHYEEDFTIHGVQHIEDWSLLVFEKK
jgi:ribosomal protein L11 methyltransferase